MKPAQLVTRAKALLRAIADTSDDRGYDNINPALPRTTTVLEAVVHEIGHVVLVHRNLYNALTWTRTRRGLLSVSGLCELAFRHSTRVVRNQNEIDTIALTAGVLEEFGIEPPLEDMVKFAWRGKNVSGIKSPQALMSKVRAAKKRSDVVEGVRDVKVAILMGPKAWLRQA